MNPTFTIETLAALTVILTFAGGVCFWLGSRIFATRKDLHNVTQRLEAVKVAATVLQNDVKWIKTFLRNGAAPSED